MQIKCGENFKSFKGFQKKLATLVEVIFDNCSIKCSSDHKFRSGDSFISAINLQPGSEVDNVKYGKSKFIKLINLFEHTVITPVEVEDTYYETANGLINHNCSFIGSSQTLVDPNILDELTQKEPIDYDYELEMAIYEKPIPGVLYIMGCDCATGVGGDYAAIQVIKVLNRNKLEQVCTYQSNTVTPGKFARIIDETSKKYNNAYYILENNDVGRQVSEELWYTLENTNLINTDKHGLGTRADKKSKLDACMELKRVIDSNILQIHDAHTIEQLSRFEEVSPNVFKGAKGTHDDLVSSLYWAIYATLQPEVDMDSAKVIENKTVAVEDRPIDMMVEQTYNESDEFWSDFK